MMKPDRLRNALVLCLTAGTLLTGCAAGQTAGGDFTPKLDESYSVQAEMEYGEGGTAQLLLTRYSGELWEAAFAEPASLAGVVLTFDGNAVSASYKGLEFTVPKSALAAKNMLEYVTDALNAAALTETAVYTPQDDGTWRCSGDSEGGSYTVTFSQDGLPLAFELPAQPLKLSFSAYTAMAAQTETSLSTAVTGSTSDTAAVTESTTAAECTTA